MPSTRANAGAAARALQLLLEPDGGEAVVLEPEDHAVRAHLRAAGHRADDSGRWLARARVANVRLAMGATLARLSNRAGRGGRRLALLLALVGAVLVASLLMSTMRMRLERAVAAVLAHLLRARARRRRPDRDRARAGRRLRRPPAAAARSAAAAAAAAAVAVARVD